MLLILLLRAGELQLPRRRDLLCAPRGFLSTANSDPFAEGLVWAKPCATREIGGPEAAGTGFLVTVR